MSKYHDLPQELQAQIRSDREKGWRNPYATKDEQVIRRDMTHDKANLWRPAFVRDTEKILHLPFYNRYTDKTQVFSFYHNDDITRRALHVQLVSRVARNIGAVLGLNLDLIEAISLGHDIGHTPFGHAGERFLDNLLYKQAGIHFDHNIQSARVLDQMFIRNVSLQTLDGIICHNGEFEQERYTPQFNKTFEDFDRSIEACGQSHEANRKLQPMTLEGCVMRISDIIAYLGKDRQDAITANILSPDYRFESEYLGSNNAQMMNNLIVDIIENSYGKDYIAMSPEAYRELSAAKKENYQVIYQNEATSHEYDEKIGPMFEMLYERLLRDLLSGDPNTLIQHHHVNVVEKNRAFYHPACSYLEENPHLIVADYIASMTDDYFLALFEKLFPEEGQRVRFHSYFD